MQTLGNARAHFWKVIKMAKVCDVDLSTALDEGKIDIESYTDMITGCQGCSQVGKCDRLLADTQHLDQAPEYCLNGDTFAQLRQA